MILNRWTLSFVLVILPICVYSGTTGKITGIVTDGQTGEPLGGANVMIVNTPLGASTHSDGYFIILNVPVGTYAVQVSYMGYRTMIQDNIRINMDLTTEVDFEMQTEVLTGETIVVTAERRMIRKDETNTNVIRIAEEIAIMPLRGIQNIISTIAGVNKLDNGAVHIRGGRGNENAVYVDGVLVNNPYNNSVQTYIPNEAIEEIGVQTGGFNAEYGEMMSGMIHLITKEGSQRYSGSVQVITDEFLSPQWKKWGWNTYSYGFNEYTATLGGPIIPGGDHTFFISGTRRWLQDGAPSWGWAENANKPDQFRGGVVPGQEDDSWHYTGKIKLRLGNNIEMKSSIIWSDRIFGFSGNAFGMNPIWLYDVEHAPQWKTQNRSFNVTFSQMLRQTTFYDLKFNYAYGFNKCYDRMFEDDLMRYGDPTYVPDPSWANDPDHYGETYSERFEPDFYKPGAQWNSYFKNKTTSWGIDFDLTHQEGKTNTIKFGFSYQYYTLREFYMANPVLLAKGTTDMTDLEKYRNADVRFYGYDVNGNEVDEGDYFTNIARTDDGTPLTGWDKQKPYHPITIGAYIQDKIEFKDLVLNVGLRYDRVDPNAWMFKDIEVDVDAEGNQIPGTGLFGGDQMFSEKDIIQSDAHDFFSPRFGVSFPVADRTLFYAQYGKFYQKPNFSDLYASPFYLDAFASRGGNVIVLNNPNLKPEKTASYEIGFKQMLSDFSSIQLAAFYKKTDDLIQVVNVLTDVKNIAFTANGDFGMIKGFDVIFNLHRYKNISASVNYEYQIALGTGSATSDHFDIAWLVGSEGHFPKFPQPLDFEQRHSGTVTIDYRLGEGEGFNLFGIYPFENTGINILWKFNSGNPFTRMEIKNTIPHVGSYDNDRISTTPESQVMGERTPWNSRIDMKIDRTFRIPYLSGSLNIFFWVLNVFNTKNVLDVWQTTGLPDNTGYLQTSAGKNYWQTLTSDQKKAYSMREMDYIHYGMPRQMRLGVRYAF